MRQYLVSMLTWTLADRTIQFPGTEESSRPRPSRSRDGDDLEAKGE